MEGVIELDKNTGYLYSFKHKCLIYIPNQNQHLLDNSRVVEYQQELLKLYNVSGFEQKIQFIELDPQIIENVTCITNQLIFEVTEKCNLSCIYCGYGDIYKKTNDRSSQNMSWQTAKTVLDHYIQIWKRFRPKNLKKFCHIGFYGGEPLLNMPLIKKIIDYLEKQSQDLNFQYSMTTNGTLIQKHIDYLIEKKIVLTVSMDGDREMNSFRIYKNGKDIYDNLYTTLKEVKEEYPDYFKKNVEFISVATSRNTNERILFFFNQEFGKTPQINELLSDQVANYEKWNLIRRKNPERSEENNNNVLLTYYLNNFSGNVYKDYKALLDNSTNIVKTPTATCLPFSLRVFITVKNDIIACERIGFEHTVGKVTGEGVVIDFKSIADFYNNIYRKFKAQCENCHIIESCDVCFLTNRKYFNEGFKCEDFYSEVQLKECITKIIKTLRNDGLDFDKFINNL